MRKIAPFIILLIFFTFVIFLIASANEKDLNIEFVDELNSSRLENIQVCVLNKDNKFVLTNITKHTTEDIYIYVLKLYDHYRNNLPLTYKTPIKGNFEVEKVKKASNVLYIDLFLEYYEDGLNQFLNALIWSYQNYGIDKLVMKINNNEFIVEKNANINPEIISSDIYNNTMQIIYYDDMGDIMPVTYYHKDDMLEFLMKKVKDKYNAISYSTLVVDKFLIINIEDNDGVLSKSVINLIIKSAYQIGYYDEVVIIVNDQDVYSN